MVDPARADADDPGGPPRPPDPPARRPTVYEVHQDRRVDDWAWLRDKDDPAVLTHLEAENAYTDAALAPLGSLRERLFEEFRTRVQETDTSVPVREGPWWYFTRTVEGQAYPVHCRVPVAPLHGSGDETGGGPSAGPPQPGSDPLPGEQVLADQNALAAGHDFFALGALEVSPDHTWLAYSVDHAGDERFTLRFRQVGRPGQADTGHQSPEALSGTSYGGAFVDNATYLYTTVDDTMRPYRVWRHHLGTEQSVDELVFEEPDQRFHVSVGRMTDGRFVAIALHSATTSEVWLLAADDPSGTPRCVAPRRQDVEYMVEHLPGAPTGSGMRGEPSAGWLVALTNDGAEDFCVVAAPDTELPVPSWRTVVPHRSGTRVDDLAVLAGHLVLAERAGGEPGLRILPLAQTEVAWPFSDDALADSFVVPADEHPSTTTLGPNPEVTSTSLRYEQTSLARPRTVVDLDLASRTTTVRKRQPVGGEFDPADYRTLRLWADAEDGTAVPISLVFAASLLDHGAGAPEGGIPPTPAPCLLYGYGAYEHSIDPVFSPLRLSLLDRGVVFAIAHVRGGGELGRRWYEEGKLALKANTFTDFVACARHLVDLGLTTPERLVARGGSAGGLLMGAVANLAPELFRAIVAEVPFVDALSTILDETLPLTVIEWEEWGNPGADPDIYWAMRAYTPYDNIRAVGADGRPVRYPDVLATAGLEDSRVGYWEPAKWVLRLREANPENQVLLRTELTAGHAGPSGRYESWRQEALVDAFVLDTLGLTG